MDCIPPGSSFHGIFQARILVWLPFPSPGDLPWPRDQTHVSWIAGGVFTIWVTGEALRPYPRHLISRFSAPGSANKNSCSYLMSTDSEIIPGNIWSSLEKGGPFGGLIRPFWHTWLISVMCLWCALMKAGPEVVNETAAQSMEKIPTYSPHIISGPNFFLAQTPCYQVEEIHLS